MIQKIRNNLKSYDHAMLDNSAGEIVRELEAVMRGGDEAGEDQVATVGTRRRTLWLVALVLALVALVVLLFALRVRPASGPFGE